MRKKVHKKISHKKSSNLFVKILFFVLIIAAVIGLGYLAKSKIQTDFSAKEKQQIEEVVNLAMEKYNVPGINVAIWIPGKGTYIKGFGFADKETKLAMDPSMSFRIGSLTKTFTSTILLQLQDEGKINLDDTLDKYITEPAIPNVRTITLRQIANMTSGIYNYTEDESFISKQKQNPKRQWTEQELVNFTIKHPPYFAPGEGYHYSNTNYVLLGMVIEKITGNHLETEMQNRILVPLKLTQTFYATNSTMPSNSNRGYSLSEDGKTYIDVTNDNPSLSAGAGAIVSDISDLKRWAQELGKGTLVSSKAQKERLTWVDEPDTTTSKYGLGIMKIGNFIGHEGSIYGYNSIIAYLPSKDAVFVIEQNTFPGQAAGIAGNIFAILAKIVLPNDVSW